MKAREFEIGDVVEVPEYNDPAYVVGVIHDQQRLFIRSYNCDRDLEVSFSQVIKQYREIKA